jgi:hypothetical protein
MLNTLVVYLNLNFYINLLNVKISVILFVLMSFQLCLSAIYLIFISIYILDSAIITILLIITFINF